MARKPADEPRRVLQSLNMSLDVLEMIASHARPIGTTEIAYRLGLSKGAVSTVLANLEARRYVRRPPETVAFALGHAARELGQAADRSFDVGALVQDELADINRLTGETAQIAGYVSPNQVVILHRIVSSHPISAAVPIGGRVPASTVASGHVLLAFQAEAEIDAVLSSPLPQITEHSVTDPEILRGMLDRVRAQGFAVTNGMHYLDTVSVYAPVRDRTGAVAYALGIYGPDYRLPDGVIAGLVPHLKRIAADLSAKLGFRPD